MTIFTGEIRMIKWGLIPTEPYFTITVGQMVGGKENLKVTTIVREIDENGDMSFHIECVKIDKENGKSGAPFVWETIYKKPESVKYFVPDEDHNYIKV